MSEAVPAAAPVTPPDTGASIISNPNALASLLRFLDATGSMVEQSSRIVPFFACLKTPSSPTI